MSIQSIMAIAALCANYSADTNRMESVVYQVESVQRDCHAFYAKCLKGKAMDDCLIERKTTADKKLADAYKGLHK